MKQFTYAGVSRLNGQLKLRFTTSEGRFLHLVKVGHTEVEMIKLTKPMTKDEAIKELLARNFDNGRSEVSNLLTGKARGAKLNNKEVVVKISREKIKIDSTPVEDDNDELTTAEARRIREAWNKKHRHLSYTE